MIEKILLMFYELNKRVLTPEDLEGVDLNEIEGSPYFLVKNGEIRLNRYYYIGKLSVKNVFSFLLQEGTDFYLYNEDILNAMDNDVVLVKATFDNVVEKVLKHSLTSFVATVKIKKDVRFFTEKNYNRKIKVSNIPDYLVNGHVVKLNVDEITVNEIRCSFDRIIGHENDPGIDILRIIAGYDFETEFSEEVLKEVNAIKPNINYSSRRDLRNELIVTIDGEDAKDLDDAISLTFDGEYHLGVHIADVSYYVKEGMEVDKSALKRGTSVYLVDRVIPMIPHYLSNNLCSLNPDTDKITISCMMDIDVNGKIKYYDIFPSVIKSYRRLNYTEVNNFIYDNVSLDDKKIDDMLVLMNELSLILKKVRNSRGSLNFKSDELKFVLGRNNKVVDVYKRETRDAEELIESFMLCANETVAEFLHSLRYPAIYRIHEKPDLNKLEKAIDTIKSLGLRVDKKVINPKALQKITNDSVGSKYEYIIHNTLLRAMQKAKYTDYLDIHYGLAAKHYTHFTSPIRRYPDLMVHRLLRELVFEPTDLSKKTKHFEDILKEIAVKSSAQERKAVDLEREVDKLKSCEYMEDKVGNTYTGMITKLTKSGMFIKLDNGIEGFSLFRESNIYSDLIMDRVIARSKSGKSYQLGDTIKIEVASVNLLDKQINFKVFDKRKKFENNITKQKSKT